MNLWKIICKLTFGIALLLLHSCLPDSFTKFEDTETAKKDATTSAGGTTTSSDGSGSVGSSNSSFSTPPDTLAFTIPHLISNKSTASKAIILEDVRMNALNGGEIKIGEMNFRLLRVLDKNNLVIANELLPDGILLNGQSGTISGKANSFIDNKTYIVEGEHITGIKREAPLKISIATAPEDLKFPQYLSDSSPGLTSCGHVPNLIKLILQVDKVDSFKECDIITSSKGAFGKVTLVDTINKLVYVDMDSNSKEINFNIGDSVDNEPVNGFFFTEATIQKISYSFRKGKSLGGLGNFFVPKFFPEFPNPPTAGSLAEKDSLRYSISPDITQFGLTFSKWDSDPNGGGAPGGTISGTATSSVPLTTFQITVKNINDISKTVKVDISILDIEEPKVLSDLLYPFNPERKQVLRISDVSKFTIGDIIEQSSTNARGRVTLIEKDIIGITGFLHIDVIKNSTSLYNKFDTNPLIKRINIKNVSENIAISVNRAFNEENGRRKVLSVNNIGNFFEGGHVTNQRGTIARITAVVSDREEAAQINLLNNSGVGKLYVDLEDGSKDRFRIGDELDNSSVFLVSIDSVQEAVENALQTRTPFSFSPKVEPELISEEFNSINWSLSPALPAPLCISNQGLTLLHENEPDCKAVGVWDLGTLTCTIGLRKSQSDCINGGSWNTGPYCLGLSGAFLAHLDSETCLAKGSWTGICSLSERNNSLDCSNSGNWINGPFFDKNTGIIYALNAEDSFPAKNFTLTATNVSGIEKTTDITLSLNSPPKNLSYNNKVLLKLDNDGADFEVGDPISSSGNGSGIITHKNIISGDTYLVITRFNGNFLVDERIDNTIPFNFQKGNIIKADQISAIINYSIGTPTAINFKDDDEITIGTCKNSIGLNQGIKSKYNCIFQNSYNFIEDAVAKIIKADSTLNNLYIRVIRGVFNTTPGLNEFGRSGLDQRTGIVEKIEADNLSVDVDAAPGTQFIKGMDYSITSTTNCSGGIACDTDLEDATGTIQRVDTVNNRLFLTVSPGSGTIKKGSKRIYRTNPHNRNGVNIANSVNYRGVQEISHDQSFYFLKKRPTGIKPTLDFNNSNSGLSFSITPPLPKGLELDNKTGDITFDENEPFPKSSKWTNYTVVASNPFGSSTHSFGIKVSDFFQIADKSGNSSGILHKSGKGFQRKDCIITQDQLELGKIDGNNDTLSAADDLVPHKDLTCLYDVGEGDLRNIDLQFEVNVGSNVCQHLSHSPYFFYGAPVRTSDPLVINPNMQLKGDFASSHCQLVGSPGTEFPTGRENAEMCLGNTISNNKTYSCDAGSIPTMEQTYTLKGLCLDTLDTKVSNLTDCGNISTQGVCSDGSKESKTSCEDGEGFCFCDKTALANNCNPNATTKVSCTNGGSYIPTDVWNPNYYHDGISCKAVKLEKTTAISCTEIGICSDNISTDEDSCIQLAETWTVTGKWLSEIYCEKSAPIVSEIFQCGGTPRNCTVGPADKLTEKDKDIVPLTKINDGNPWLFNYGKITDYQATSSLPLANFINFGGINGCFENNGFEFKTSNWNSNLTSKKAHLDADSILNPFAGANPYYTFNCHDSGYNIIGRIRVLVREWDRSFKAIDDVDTIDPSFDDPTDEFGRMDNDNNNDFGIKWDDFKDWRGFRKFCKTPITDMTRCKNSDFFWLDDALATGVTYCINPKISNEDDCVSTGSSWVDYNNGNTCADPVLSFPSGDL